MNRQASGRPGSRNARTLARLAGTVGAVLLMLTGPCAARDVIDYDGAGRLTDERREDGSRSSYTYDPAGNILTVVELAGDDPAVAHDAASAPTSRLLALRPSAKGEISFLVKSAGSGATELDAGIALDDPEWIPMAIRSIPDIDQDGDNEAGVLMLNPSTGQILVQVRDGDDGGFVKNLFFLNADWTPLDVVVIPSVGGGPAADVAVLAVNGATGEIVASVKDAATNAFIRNVFFLNPNWTALRLLAIPAFDANAGSELGVLATNPTTGQIVVMVKDAGTNSFIRNVFFLNENWRVHDVAVLPSIDGNAVPDIVLLASNRSSGQIVAMIKDAGSNTFIRNLFPLGSAWTPLGLAVVNGNDAAPQPEVAVLGVNATGKLAVQLRDAGSNAFVANLFPLGSAWSARGLIAYPNLNGSGGGDMGLLADRRSDGRRVVQLIDGQSGAVIRNLFVP